MQLDRDQAIAFLELGTDSDRLLVEARRIRDEVWGRMVTFSKKVFIPLTTLCQDKCAYCTFAKPPGNGGEYLTPEDVLAIAKAGEAAGCTEALITLGDQPELRWEAAREFLAARGHATTLEYVQEMTELIVAQTDVFPHANPGLMSVDSMRAMRPSNASMGMMLENISPRLLEPGMPHFDCPDKEPSLRVATIEASGEAKVPFTTGVLIGIGENVGEVVDSILALRDLCITTRSIQEVIVQNFRAKADTRMRRSPEPVPAYFARVIALTRLLIPAEVSVQVPPNLTDRYETYLDAGINDWGGVSPLTIDWVNPEQPWPQLAELEARSNAHGFDLRQRLPVYPRYLTEEWVDPGLLSRLRSLAYSDGYLAPSSETTVSLR